MSCFWEKTSELNWTLGMSPNEHASNGSLIEKISFERQNLIPTFCLIFPQNEMVS